MLFLCWPVILRIRGSNGFPSVENFSSLLTWAAFKSQPQLLAAPRFHPQLLHPSSYCLAKWGFSLSVLFHIRGIWVTESACGLHTASPLPYYSWLRSSNNKHLTSGMPFPFGLLSRLHKGLQFIWIQGNQLPQSSVVSLMQGWSPPLTFSLLGKKRRLF